MTLPLIMIAWFVLSLPVVHWAERDREPASAPSNR